MKNISFDKYALRVLSNIPIIGDYLVDQYIEKEVVRKFIKYFTSIFIVYWGVRAPLQWLLIDKWGLWHQLGTFIAGCIVSLIGFGYSHFWVWRKEDG